MLGCSMAFAVVLCLFGLALSATAAEVVQLTDSTFEHDTQAATGSTTGDWFIKFYAPWCGHCRAIEGTWKELAEDLDGEVNVAEVDCTKNAPTCQRFNVRGYPTLLFLSKGNVYQFQGARDKTSLTVFARGGYEDVSPSSVPGEPSFIWVAIAEIEKMVSEVQIHDDPMINAALVGVSLALILMVPLVILLVITNCVTGSNEPAAPTARAPPAATQATQATQASQETKEAEEKEAAAKKAKKEADAKAAQAKKEADEAAAAKAAAAKAQKDAEAEAKAKKTAEAEAKAKKAKAEAEAAEKKAAEAKQEADKKIAEAKAKKEAEKKAKKEAEEKAQKEAEAKAKQEAEEKAKQEAAAAAAAAAAGDSSDEIDTDTDSDTEPSAPTTRRKKATQ
eukprot:m.353725 g.353725  ORF g.353725 m.353725 type:complete len:392 (+) comp16828_c0_seq1:253-1428(+)